MYLVMTAYVEHDGGVATRQLYAINPNDGNVRARLLNDFTWHVMAALDNMRPGPGDRWGFYVELTPIGELEASDLPIFTLIPGMRWPGEWNQCEHVKGIETNGK